MYSPNSGRETTMTKPLAEYLHGACIDHGVPTDLREYSGRFMYGQSTWAIVVDGTVLDVLEAVLKADEFYDGTHGVDELRQDQMGLGIVIY